jgi:putative endopeptidase
MKTTLLLGAGLLLPLAAAQAADAAIPATPEQIAALHLDWIDSSADPARDFFQFANGSWLKKNPIPAAYSSWGVDQILSQQNQDFIHELLQSAAQDSAAAPGSEERKIGDFYASGMDEDAIEKAGAAPLAPELQRIEALQQRVDLTAELAHLQMIGVDALFDIGQMQDFKDSTKVIGVAMQGGLGLPDRDYYLKADAKFAKIRAAYLQHLGRSFALLGDSPANAAREARTVMAFETRLARASMPVEAQRDPRAIYHLMDQDALHQAAPAIDWLGYFQSVGHPELQQINLAMPQFFAAASREMLEAPLADWRVYLRWHLVEAYSPYLSRAFVDESFRLTQVLRGNKEQLPRWRRVANAEDHALGFAVGHLYVQKKFPPEAKQQVLDILHGIRAALKQDIAGLPWMSEATRAKALDKLALIEERIGYPDVWRDYGALAVDRGPYALNMMRANTFENARELDKIGKPVDRNDWDMTPQEVNAYYDPSMNNINFPAGILQPPYFDPKATLAVNYGAIGAVIGHEITHGFDDEGSQFDGHGNLVNWWTEADTKRFQSGVDCIADQFSQYTVDGGLHVKGKLVTGEAIADLGGLLLALRAFEASPGAAGAPVIGGYTPQQQLFISYGHSWADMYRPELARELATANPHPLPIFRVNGTLANIAAFQQAFKVPQDSPLARKDACVIW